MLPRAMRGNAGTLRSLVLPASPTELPADLVSGERINLLLPGHLVLRRTLTLPAAATAHLRQAIRFLIPRHTPFVTDSIHYAVRIVGRDRDARSLRVEFVVVPRQTIDLVLDALSDRRIFPRSIVLQDEASMSGAEGLDFALPAGWERRAPWHAKPWRLILAAAGAVLVVGCLSWQVHLHARADALRLAIAGHADAARQGAALRAAWQARLRERDFLPNRRLFLEPVEVLDAISRVLPDDTWLFALELAPDSVIVSGFTPAVPMVLAALGRVPGFAAPTLRTPVTRDAAGDRQRFDIAIGLKRAVP